MSSFVGLFLVATYHTIQYPIPTDVHGVWRFLLRSWVLFSMFGLPCSVSLVLYAVFYGLPASIVSVLFLPWGSGKVRLRGRVLVVKSRKMVIGPGLKVEQIGHRLVLTMEGRKLTLTGNKAALLRLYPFLIELAEAQVKEEVPVSLRRLAKASEEARM